MPIIYQKNGLSLYDNAGKTYNAQTGAAVEQLGTPQPPTDTSKIVQTKDVTLPNKTEETPNTSDVSGLVSYYGKKFEVEQQKQDDYQKQIETARAAQEKQTKPFLDKILGSESPEEARTKAKQETGINAKEYFAEQKSKLAEIETLNTEYNSLVKERDTQIANLQGQGRGIPLDLLDNQRAQIERNAAPRLNALSANIKSKAALVEAEQGRFNEAEKYINQAVSDSTADLKYNMDLFREFYDNNQDTINSLETKYKNALKEGMSAAEDAYKTAFNEKTAVGKLMIDNPQAGVSIIDSLSTAYQKITLSGGSLESQRERRLGAEGDSGTTNFNDIMQAAINESATPQEAARAAAAVSEASGIQVDQKTLTQWTNYAKTLKKAVAATTETTPAPLSRIDQEIVSIRDAGTQRGFPQSKDQIRNQLKKRGFSSREIGGSSVGSPLERASNVADTFFSNLFGG